MLKTALYDRRVELPEHDILLRELLALERDARTGRVDHPPRGSKDLADGLAGVVYGLTMHREVWHQHRVNPYEAAPQFVRSVREGRKDVDGATEEGRFVGARDRAPALITGA